MITDESLDLLAMAPTGSGKTAVALCAILQAFRRGKKACYTSPIKALSNQKYAEFKSWFGRRRLGAGVTLLTGDIKIRAPPGTVHELIICTSEILRNKLVKGPETESVLSPQGETQGWAPPDLDLDNLGVVVSDEIHYINDVDRGNVWEETLMHLPISVQMVALSATLRQPEVFLDWISKARYRPGRIVKRTDRHVPLHVGGLRKKSGSFLEFFGTHGARAGVFESANYESLVHEIKNPEQKATCAENTAARGERDAEREARRLASVGGGKGGGGGRAGGRGGGRGGSKGSGKGSGKDGCKVRGKGGRTGQGGPSVCFSAEVVKLARHVSSDNKLPGIVFCMSRKHCVAGARAVAAINLLNDARRGTPPGDEAPLDEHEAYHRAEVERQAACRANARFLQTMHRTYLQRYMPELGELEAYTDLQHMLERGVAYHHSGMLPILREFVELCFQQKLIKLVFATETLAVGVNMPARSVVFSQLDKPNDGTLPGHRCLRPDEFWQMAGRAGRRGMDELGYVIYAPTLSVAGLSNMAKPYELREMLVGSMPAASSQLAIDRPFVLRHINKGYGPQVMQKTLLADELRRRTQAITTELKETASESAAADSAKLVAAARLYRDLSDRLEGKSDEFRGMGIVLNSKERKKIEAELTALKGVHGEALAEVAHSVARRDELKREMDATQTAMFDDWNLATKWLFEYRFIADPNALGPAALTPRGRACAAFADGHPLIIGTIISDGWLAQLELKEVCAWLCLFLSERKLETRAADIEFPTPSPALAEVFDETDQLAEMLEVELEQTLALMMLDWCEHKDIRRIAMWLDPHMLGIFVKAVLRVVSYLDIAKEVLTGLNDYEVLNRLDHHTALLMGGLVTNESLYLRIE